MLPVETVMSFERQAQSGLQTSRAPLSKEKFAGFWHQQHRDQRRSFCGRYASACRSKLHSAKSVVRTLENHLRKLLAYFVHLMVDAVAEGLNSRIQTIRCAVRGLSTFRRLPYLYFLRCWTRHVAAPTS